MTNDPKTFSVSFKLKKLLYIELIAHFKKGFSLFLYTVSCFFNKKKVFAKRLIAILLSFLSLSSTFNVLATAQELQISKSSDIAVGFGKDGKLLQVINSKYLAVGVENPVPLFLDKEDKSLVHITPNIGVAPQIVTFDASRVVNSDRSYDLTYSWDFGENESENENTSIDTVATHKYTKPGKYLVTLNVLNAYGRTNKVTKEIEIRDKNEAPEGTFDVSATSSDVPLTVTFNAMVTDKENDEIKYKWDFGDGQTSTESNPTHIYNIAGNYNPKLTVADVLDAKTTITSVKLTVLPLNNPPITQATAIPQESTLKLNAVGLFTSKVQLLSNNTYDPDGEELTYKWDFGDGTTTSDQNPLHEYKNDGEYKAKLTVTDSRGGKDTKEILVSVLKPKPIAQALITQSTGNAPLEVIFDGTASQDFDGRPVTLKWDFGDTSSETIFPTDSTTGNVKHTYSDPGVYLVTLTALSPDNRYNTINIGNIIVGPNNGPVGQITKLEGDEKGILGKAKVKLSSKGSFDPLNDSQPLKYKWSWSARTWDLNGNLIDISKEVNDELSALSTQQSAENTQEEFSYIFTKAGQFTPVLEIETASSTKSKFFGETFTISNEQAPIAVAKIISDKTEGDIGLEVGFDGSGSYDPKANGGLKILTWDFGDLEKSTEVSPKHIYNSEGTFTPTLVVVDSENNIGFAQTSSIKILKNTNSGNTNDLLSRKILFQTVDPLVENSQSKEELQELTDSMIKEALSLYASSDNTKPQIGPITVEPKTVNAGGVIKLSAFIKDDTGLSNFGYVLLDSNEKAITEKVIDLINQSKDKVIKNEHYVEEQIQIPKDLPEGAYKLKLSAVDISSNQIAKIRNENTDTNEEIAVILEVTANGNIQTRNTENIILPTEEVEQTDSSNELRGRKGKASEQISNTTHTDSAPAFTLNHDNNENLLFIRGKNIIQNQTDNREKGQLKIDGHKSNLRFQINGFEVSNLSGTINPWISFAPSKTNSLELDVISDRDGYIVIGLKGSLTKTYFGNWTNTNVYIDNKKAGTIFWGHGAAISFTSSASNPRVKVQFRPANRWGAEMPSETWSGNYFTFTKILKPEITSLSQNEVISTRGAFNLTLYGNNFRESSKVLFDGYELTPSSNGQNVLTVRVPAYLVSNYGIKSIYVRNPDNSISSTSNQVPFTVKANQNIQNICTLNKTLPQRQYGGSETSILNGNNTYINGSYATIEGNGSLNIPFCLDDTYEVKTQITLTQNTQNTSSPRCNFITFKLDGSYIGGSSICNNTWARFGNLNTSNLSSGPHLLEISFSGNSSDALTIEEINFTNGGGPVLDSISPGSVALSGIRTPLTLYGRNFDENTSVYLAEKLIPKTSFTNKEIKINLPEKFDSPGQKRIYLIGNNKRSTDFGLIVRDKPELLSESFKVLPIQPFPGNNFNVELKVKDDLTLPNSNYTAFIAVFDPDGKLITLPNISNNFSTINIKGEKEDGRWETGTVSFKGTIPLDISAKPGNYNVFGCVIRKSGLGEDYSDFETIKYLSAKSLGLSYSDGLIPPSHKLTFTPKPAVVTVFGIKENTNENIGFVSGGNKIIQDGQTVKFKTQISTGSEHANNLRYNFISGDGRESGLINSDGFDFVYNNSDTSSSTPKTFFPKLEVFWQEDSIQTKIATHNGPTVLVYPNYYPIAKARVFGDTFSVNTPLMTSFIDSNSYDPNQIFSSGIDFVNSKNNIWELFKLSSDGHRNVISHPVDSKISDDKKTFLSGTLFNPGSYFAKLTVRDQTGLTDSASTESVTVTKPHQKVIVFASTEPSDKKVFDPLGETTTGVPVKFKSNVTVLGGNASLSYKWDFGDGSCGSTNEDCTSPNPTHYYFDGKRSFGGKTFIDRKSVTPKLTVTARFQDGRTERWEASAGTITFNSDPHFVLLDIRPDQTSGIVPLTVNFMIDSQSAKQVNASVVKYEIDYKDGTIDSGDITFDELINKTFIHTYLPHGTYTPKLTVYIAESSRKFEFNVPSITVSGTGIAPDDISTVEDGLTLEKEQGDILNIEREVLMIDQNTPKLFREFRWRTIDELDKLNGEGTYNSESNENNIFINYETIPGIYILRLSQDLLNGTQAEKNFTLVVKDIISPEIEELELISGSVTAASDEFSFRIKTSDNAKLMSLNWTLINKVDNSVVFNGRNELTEKEETKEITFIIPENLSAGEYKLIAEVIDSAGNVITSTRDFNSDISVLDKKYAQLLTGLEPVVLTGSVSESFFALGAASSVFPVLLPVLGLTFIANIFDLFNPPTFDDKLKNNISDLTNNYIQEVDMILCSQHSRLLNNITNLGDLSNEENKLLAAKLALLSASKAKKKLRDFEGELKKGGRFELLNTQSASVTVVPKDRDFDIVKGGNRTKEFSNSFYLPNLVSSTKDALNSVSSTRAHEALAILFNSKDLSSLFNKDVKLISNSEDEAYKLIEKSYELIEKSNDRLPEIVQAFTSGDLSEIGINYLSDFNENQNNEKRIISSYIQRLLQDLGVRGPTDGLLIQEQASALKNLTINSSFSPQDVKSLKDKASRARSTFVGLRNKNILVTKNREDGYNTFVGTLFGTLVSGIKENTLNYLDLISVVKTGDILGVVDYVLSSEIDELTLGDISSKLYGELISLISTLYKDERRQNVINELIQVVGKLKDYSSQRGYSNSKENFEGIEYILGLYTLPILQQNEDNLGLLINKHISKLNVYKEVFRNNEEYFYSNKKWLTETNNDLIARRITTGVPLKLVKKVTHKDDILASIDIQNALAFSTVAIKKKYSKTLLDKESFENNDSIELGLLDVIDHALFNEFSPVGKMNKIIKHIFKRFTIENDPKELQKLINNLRHLANIDKKELQDRVIYPLVVENLSEITPNKKETEVVSYLSKEINSKLHPRISINSQVPLSLILTLDKDIASTIVQTRTVKEIIRDVFLNSYKDKVFAVDGTEFNVNETFDPGWIREIDTNLPTDTDINTSNKTDTEITTRKRIINELSTITETQKSILIEQDLIPIDVTADPMTLFGNASYCEKVNNKIVREVPSEYSLSNTSFTYALDSLGNPTSITLMTSISLTGGAPNGITGSYNLLDIATGMIIYVEPFNILDPIPVAKYVDLPVKTLSGGTLQAIISKLGNTILNGLIVIIKVGKTGAPIFPLLVEFLDPEPVGEELPKQTERPLAAPYVECSPLTQTITKGETAKIGYIAGPEYIPHNVKISSSDGNINKDGKDDGGVVEVKPIDDTTITFTSTSPQGTSKADCSVNVQKDSKKPGEIIVNVDDRYVHGYDTNENKKFWHYPVQFKIDGMLAGVIDYWTNMSAPITVKPESLHKVTLTVNNKDVDSEEKFVSEAPPPISFSFTGGIWRHYRSAELIPLIITSMFLVTTNPGDIEKGTYFSDLAEAPDCIGGEKTYAIARLLRLFNKDAIAPNGDPVSVDNPKPGKEIELLGIPPFSNKFYKETSTSYIDLLFNSISSGSLIQGNSFIKTLRRQYVFPSNEDFFFLEKENNIFRIDHFINFKDCR